MFLPEDDTIRSINHFLYALGLQHGFRREIRARMGEIARGEVPPESLAELFQGVSKDTFYLAERVLRDAAASNIKVCGVLEPGYPKRLRAIADPPLVFFYRGVLPDESLADGTRFYVGLVGTRHPSRYGRSMARNLATKITQAGGIVVSGLAAGVDTESHQGALEALEGETGKRHPGVAVLGSGLLKIYPKENASLADALTAAGGAVVSEYGLTEPPRQQFFPERNRIISGLSDAIVVVEAGEKSGALITARLAIEQGRDVGAVPGGTQSPMSVGPNMLLKSGAAMVRGIEDVLELLPLWAGPKRVQKRKTKSRTTSEPTDKTTQEQLQLGNELGVGEDERQELSALRKLLSERPIWNFDELVERFGKGPAELTSLLSLLELSGQVATHPGHQYSLSKGN